MKNNLVTAFQSNWISLVVSIIIIGVLVFLARKRVSFGNRVFIGLGLGLVAGVAFNQLHLEFKSVSTIGSIYVNLIKMLVMPLVLILVINSISSLSSLGQDQLGHSSPNSLIPYLATSSPEIQQYYSDIFKEGVWGNVVNKLEEPTDLELDPLLEQAAKVVQAEDNEQFISSLIEKFKGEEVEFGFSNDASFMPVNNVSAGFPRFTHNCVAHEMLNCGHTELHCFKCDYYKPDDDKYNEHIAEIFRFMLLALRGEEMAKSKRETTQKELVSIRANDIIELIDESFPKLLEKKFSITPREVPKLKKGLWDKAKSYWKKYKQTKPILTFEEALHYLKEGKLEWVGKEASQ